ncbi:tetratricopeptide repeat protein [Actinophytocola sp.]|uniref:tetratricopeptide repeat protein n=1 Tax=Actinophytocola sp. TaxID=1872138 RepID=UPI002D2F4016|nr:tetratricopeptide repeat protein [Actinophytocola sp.]HYQ68619.1 tetratricopeptide repeat protein [Actinophytocola sp.]
MTERDERRDADAGVRVRLAKASSPEEQIDLLKRHFIRRARSKSTAWIDDLADVAEECRLELPVVRQAVSDLAWQAREVGQPLLADSENGGRLSAGSVFKQLCRQYLQGFRLRFDFKFEALGAQLPAWLRGHPGDALLLALSAFAGLGRGAPGALRAVETSLGSSNSDAVSRNVCLHALWFGNHIEDQAERIVQLSDEIINRGEDGANLYFWRAYALRRMERFDDALKSIDQAISLHPVGMNIVHQDYVRERALITTSRLLFSQVAEHARQVSEDLREELHQQLESAKAELVQKQEDAQRAVSDSLLKIVEILGLFIALVGFLAGSGVIVFRAIGFWQHFASMSILLVGAIVFFVLLRLVINHKPVRRYAGSSSRSVSRRAKSGEMTSAT